MPVRPTLALAALAASAALASPASAADLQVEQINRATGTAGAFGLTAAMPSTRVGGITSDGRRAYFHYRSPMFGGGAEFALDANPGEGLWMRDLARNRTTRIAGGEGLFTGLDRTEHLLSFVTTEALSPADTNTLPDLYAFEPTTGLKILVSRQTGFRGAATGLTSFGTVTRGSRIAIFGTAGGVFRRDLLTGRTTRVASGSFLGALEQDQNTPVVQVTADQFASADGRVIVTADGIRTPSGTTPLPRNGNDEPILPFINEAGTKAVWQDSLGSLDSVRVMDLATGAVTTPEIPEPLAGAYGFLVRPTPSGDGGYFATAQQNEAGEFLERSQKWVFDGGAVTDLGLSPIVSRSERFGISAGRSGALLAFATPGNTLPGTVDPPSPNAYVSYDDGCQWNDDYTANERYMTISPEFNQTLPAATSARIQAAAGPGQPVVVDRAVAVPTADGYDPELIVELPFADGAFSLDLTITLADGRTITEHTDHVARPARDGCGL